MMRVALWVWLIAGPPIGYMISCWLWPFAHCWRCHGAGRISRNDRKVFRPCRWCAGSGRRLRVGRRVWNYAADRRR